MTMEDIRLEGRAGRLDAIMTAVVVDGPKGKEYRLPTDHERAVAHVSEGTTPSPLCRYSVRVAGGIKLAEGRKRGILGFLA